MRLALALIVLAGCAHDVRSHFPSAPGAPTGTLVLMMSQPADDVTVAINGILAVDHVHSGRIVIDGIPVGTTEVAVAGGGIDKDLRVWVDGDHATTVPLAVPDPSAGFLKGLIGTLVTIVVYSMIH
ncbi:MAG TPA: hypothetical protein VLX92_28455 [Kofleriaceae bacterium]|nr:hypothetical protein [Kofleriaceae bacterium]